MQQNFKGNVVICMPRHLFSQMAEALLAVVLAVCISVVNSNQPFDSSIKLHFGPDPEYNQGVTLDQSFIEFLSRADPILTEPFMNLGIIILSMHSLPLMKKVFESGYWSTQIIFFIAYQRHLK